MTIQECVDIFNHFIDEFGMEGVTDWEISRSLNTAQFELLREYDYSHRQKANAITPPQRGAEQTQYDERAFDILTKTLTLTTNVSGELNIATDIESTFTDDTIYNSDGTTTTRKPKVWHIESVARKNSSDAYKKARWVRQNDYEEIASNPFKKGEDDYPIWRSVGGVLVIEPVAARDVRITVKRMPYHMNYDSATPANNVNPELIDTTMIEVIKRALQYHGINTSDDKLFQLSKAIEQ